MYENLTVIFRIFSVIPYMKSLQLYSDLLSNYHENLIVIFQIYSVITICENFTVVFQIFLVITRYEELTVIFHIFSVISMYENFTVILQISSDGVMKFHTTLRTTKFAVESTHLNISDA